jgi:hypothetical protein
VKRLTALCSSLVALVFCGMVIAQDPPTTRPADSAQKDDPARTPNARPPANRVPSRWGYAPYNKLQTLSEEQKAQIHELRKQFLAERKALEEKLEAEVMAVLNDENKAELDKLQADEKAARKERDAARRQAAKDKKDADGGDDDADKDR